MSPRDGVLAAGAARWAAPAVRRSGRLSLHRDASGDRIASFADDVRSGLAGAPKRLPPKWFYDDLGSSLFEAITRLPEYYLTRAEGEILASSADEMIAALDAPLELVELGSGSATKTRRLIEAALRRQDRLRYDPIDISAEALTASAEALIAAHPGLEVTAFASDYLRILDPALLRRARPVLALFLGSNIGNYAPDDARRLLTALAHALKAGDALLLGVDVKKAPAILEAAYDDPTGVTAAFNKNLLARINREFDADFDLRSFDHVARYDSERGAVDSFLAARAPQRVEIRALGMSVEFAAGETIHTESSYKFDDADIERLATAAGFRYERSWSDAERRFRVALLRVVGEPPT